MKKAWRTVGSPSPNAIMHVDTWTEDWTARHGGSKAKRDVVEILRRRIPSLRCHAVPNLLQAQHFPDGNVAILQFPTRGISSSSTPISEIINFVNNWERCAAVRMVVLHDIKSLQMNLFDDNRDIRGGWDACERLLLNSATDVVVHTEQMEHRVRALHGCDSARFWHLSLFDYLCDPPPPHFVRPRAAQQTKVAFVGNLHATTLAEEFAKQLPSRPGLTYRFYGSWLPSQLWTRDDITWVGDFLPEELPGRLATEADVGLCWWSESVLFGRYLDLIAPHKASCYLAAGLPICAPSGSYIASVATRDHVGFQLDRLADIGHFEDRSWMDKVDLDCVAETSAQIRRGDFLGAVVDLALPNVSKPRSDGI